jgi:hypothetical protein
MTEKTDLNEFLDEFHVPEDAGEYAEDLGKILKRIPPRWGRWISCDRGWYPLIIELDQKLAEIFPDYELHQVKEKFGTLRYYIGFPELNPQCCIDLEATRPHEGAIDPKWLFNKERTVQEQYELDAWFYTKYSPHFDSEEHNKQSGALEPERERRRALYTQMEEIISEYEYRSARTCEITGAPGELMRRGYWYKTLSKEAAPEGYVPVSELEEEDSF